MTSPQNRPYQIIVFVAPFFNVSATTSFIDPFRVANYLFGETLFAWTYCSEDGGMIESSSGLAVHTEQIKDAAHSAPWLGLVSTSWTPEDHNTAVLRDFIRAWWTHGVILGGLDTGAFILSEAGVLKDKAATVHYEHIDAFAELVPDTVISENLYVADDRLFTCCGGTATTDVALRLLHSVVGESLANATARYLFHQTVRGPDQSQNPKSIEPMGYTTPAALRRAIDLMEKNLETSISIPELCTRLGLSQRQLSRLFHEYVKKSPAAYYRDIRLDRARGLVIQTELKLSEIAVASGFNSQVHFSRAYSKRFGLSPSADRVAGRVPFEFRAWPMFAPGIKTEGPA